MASRAKSAKSAIQEAAAAAAGQDSAAEMEVQIAALKAEIAKLRKQAASSSERSAEAIKAIAQEGVHQVRSQGQAAMQNLRENADDIEAQIVATVREKPMTSLAVAAGIGFLFALIARR
jgi:ElaB/YqjD/DUF883 family membrane-anchored ribosome-binding protein